MRNKFSLDVFFFVIAPFATAFIGVLLGSLIYHVTQWNQESVMDGTVGGTVVCIGALCAYLRRRQQRGDFSDTHRLDELRRSHIR